MEFIVPFVLGFGITWALSSQQERYNQVHLKLADLLNTKYADSHRVVNVVRELSLDNVSKGNREYECVLDVLHEKEQKTWQEKRK